MTDSTERYPFLFSFLDQAEAQLTEDEWKSLVQDIERFKLDVGVVFLKDFVSACRDEGMALDSVVDHLDEAVAGMYESKNLEPPSHG